MGPDYSDVDKTQAAAMLADGRLAKLLLLPQMFGGQDVPENVVPVPPSVLEEKERIDQEIVRPLALERRVTRYQANPCYDGDSFVPTAIEIVASGAHDFRALVRIWGSGLTEP